MSNARIKDNNGQKSARQPLLEVTDMTKNFWLDRRRIDVLRGASMSIYEAETIAIVGASGAGKSTLLHILGTLDTPTSGQFTIEGQDVLALTEEELAGFRNRTIGFVFQAHYLLPEFTALENVMMPAFIRRLSRKESRKRADELLDWVGLSHRKEHRPGELSGGERQRVALCRALVMRPRILLADEPTGNLDATTAGGIHELLQSLKSKWRVTPIVVTHNLELASKMERCFHLVEGRLEEREAAAPVALMPMSPTTEGQAEPEQAKTSQEPNETTVAGATSKAVEERDEGALKIDAKGFNFSEQDFREVISSSPLSEDDAQELLDATIAAHTGDGSLSRSEFEDAAWTINEVREKETRALKEAFATLSSEGYDFSEQDVQDVMAEYDLADPVAFASVVMGLSRGNKSLSRKGLERAARAFHDKGDAKEGA